MILPRFDLLVPETVGEACKMLVDHAEDGVRLLSGGTDLLVALRCPIIPQHVPRCDGCPTHPEGQILTTIDCQSSSQDQLMSSGGSIRAALSDPRKAAPAYLVSLHKLKQLKGIERLNDGGLRAGALTTITEIERSTEIREGWTALAEGADNLGSPLVRNRGTLGGNIANARPAADTAIPTIALNATLSLRGPSGVRTVPSEDFHRGPGLSVIEPNEILTDICFPPPAPCHGSSYYKLATRKALDISTVGVAVWLALEAPDGPVQDVRVALGAVGPTPILAKSVKEILVGRIPDEAALIEAARAGAGDARPIDDHRGSAWYRVRMVELLILRLLRVVVGRAGGER
ncbi:MAG: FAD binding domain-containing protein [candidate division Zixibacteria bacterium]|nr:FAD binding domain-containing protein [candidate division Zixibacteria bacterium]